MLLKTVYQWDIDTGENLDAFREESGDIHQQVKRAIYRRNSTAVPGQGIDLPYGSREEFLDWLTHDLETYRRQRETKSCDGRAVVVKAVVEHRDGKPVRSEFLKTNGVLLPYFPEPNRGGLLAPWRGQADSVGYLVEDPEGRVRFDQDLYRELNLSENHSDEAAQLVRNAMERLLLRKDLDDQDESLMYDLLEIIGASEGVCEHIQRNRLAQRLIGLNPAT